MAIERYGSKTDVVVKLVLVFFVCLLSFSVGTFVGKKFSDNQHKLAEFEPSNKEREVASVEGAHGEEHGEKKSDTLTDQEIAKLAEEFVSEDEGRAPAKAGEDHGTEGHGTENEKKIMTDKNSAHEEPHTQAAHAAPAAAAHSAPPAAAHGAPAAASAHAAPPASTHGEAVKPTNAHEVTEAQAKTVERKIAQTTPIGESAGAGAGEKRPLLVAEKTAAGHSPKIAEEVKKALPIADAHAAKAETNEAAVVKKPIPTSLPKELAASTLGKFTVQVASYPAEPEAKKMAETLTGQGFSAFYLKADIKGKSWYRVSVGLFPSSKEADAYKADLLARAKVTSAIVQQITGRTAGEVSK